MLKPNGVNKQIMMKLTMRVILLKNISCLCVCFFMTLTFMAAYLAYRIVFVLTTNYESDIDKSV